MNMLTGTFFVGVRTPDVEGLPLSRGILWRGGDGVAFAWLGVAGVVLVGPKVLVGSSTSMDCIGKSSALRLDPLGVAVDGIVGSALFFMSDFDCKMEDGAVLSRSGAGAGVAGVVVFRGVAAAAETAGCLADNRGVVAMADGGLAAIVVVGRL